MKRQEGLLDVIPVTCAHPTSHYLDEMFYDSARTWGPETLLFPPWNGHYGYVESDDSIGKIPDDETGVLNRALGWIWNFHLAFQLLINSDDINPTLRLSLTIDTSIEMNYSA